MNKYLQVIFIFLSFLSISLSVGMHDLNYLCNISSADNYCGKIYSGKTLFVQNFSDISTIIKSPSILLSSRNPSLKHTGFANCLECQNIPAFLFNINGYFFIIFVFAMFYIFLQTLFIFPIVHPPKFSYRHFKFII
jgi:hypothetical protein